mmetsp:Transcript_57612/g.135051  ORF Transcript_57612/g.135051 Transcript_57612/m.135051 type:complete len:650 (-) Transcript_57612:25-1974(-)
MIYPQPRYAPLPQAAPRPSATSPMRVKVVAPPPRATICPPKATPCGTPCGTPCATPLQAERPPEYPGLARNGSQSTIIAAQLKGVQCQSPSTPARMPRAASPPFASPVRPGAASPGSPLPSFAQDRRVLAVATPLRAEELSGAWSRECVLQLCSEGDEALFLGRVRLLDRQIVTSITDAVDSLNRRLAWCPEDTCAVFNAADRTYYLLYRAGCKEQALARFGRPAEPSKESRGSAVARLGRQDSLPNSGTTTGPPSRGSFGASPSEASRIQFLPFKSEERSPVPSRPRSRIPGSPSPPAPQSLGDVAAGRFASPVRRAFQACRRGQSENCRARKPLVPSKVSPIKAPIPVPTKLGFSTPREALERGLTEPEKVRYSDLSFVERLGKGEFGEVFRGLYLNKEVAIKQLFFDENMTELVVQDLAREIDSFRHLNHKRLVRFLGACLDLPNLCLVTEYMPGGSLHHLLHVRRQKLPQSHAMNMCIQIADGVSYLHSQTPTIVHRDLKSLNVVLDLSLNIKICDFGLTESMDRTHITKKNNGGSPRYMAPELFDSKTKITEKIDVWAMGCIFVEICGGPLPYENITTLADLTKEMLIRRRTPDIPDFITGMIRDICSSCLSFHYEDRPSSKQAFELLKAAKRASREVKLTVTA